MEILEFVKRLHDECIHHSEHIVFDKKHSRHLYLVALYGTLIEMAGSLTTLIEWNQRTGVPTIYRSILEAYVELKNLHENSEYAYHMDASYHCQWIKVFKEAKKKPNPYLKSISVIENLDENLQKSEQELTELKKKGRSKAPTIAFDFETMQLTGKSQKLENNIEAYELIKLLSDEKETITSSDVQELTGLDAAAVRPLFQRLLSEGLAVREGKGRGAKYIFTGRR